MMLFSQLPIPTMPKSRAAALPAIAMFAVCVGCAPCALAQTSISHRGGVSAMFDALPNAEASELRLRLEDTVDVEIGDAWTVKAGSWIDGLVGSRSGRDSKDLVYQPGEIYARYRRPRFDLTAGFQRVVWGTLDEIQPTDVINPIDVSRFIFEGRGEARLPVLALRGRLFLPGDTTVDGVYVPFFRRGRYDLVDEASSPFNLLAGLCSDGVCPAMLPGDPGSASPPTTMLVPLLSEKPALKADNGSIGVRASRPVKGIDVGVTAWRGWQAFPLWTLDVGPLQMPAERNALSVPAVVVRESWSRVTMLGFDAEAARGAFTWRAEGAWLVDTAVQAQAPGEAGAASLGPVLDGRSLQLGAGLDWTAAPWRTFANVLVRRKWAVGSSSRLVPSSGGVQLVAGADRKFARETWVVRGFAVIDPTEGTAFVRGLASWNVRDNLWLEGSAAAFTGDGTDVLGMYTDRDFASVRIKYFF